MSSIFDLKEWYSLAESANYLSKIYSETVTELSLITHAIQNNITLSVILPNPEWAFKCDLVDNLEQENNVVVYTWNGKKIIKTDNVVSLIGIYDIPPYSGGGWLFVENQMNKFAGNQKRQGTEHDFHAGTYLVDGLGNTYKIKGGINFSRAIKPYNKKKNELIREMMIKNVDKDVFEMVLKNHDDEANKELTEANNTCQLPDTAHLVVRKTAIEEFIEKHENLKVSFAKKAYIEEPLKHFKHNQVQSVIPKPDQEQQITNNNNDDILNTNGLSVEQKKLRYEQIVKDVVVPYLRKTYTTTLIPDIHHHFRNQDNYKKAKSLAEDNPGCQDATLELTLYKIYDDSKNEKQGVIGSRRQMTNVGNWLRSVGFKKGLKGKNGHAKGLIKTATIASI